MTKFTNATTSTQWQRFGIITGTQMAKTTNVLNVGLRKIDDDPAPVLYIGPTQNNVTTVIEPQVEAAIESSASLKKKRAPGGKRRKLEKKIAGVSFRLAWAGSATEIAAAAAAVVIVDEYDKCEPIPGHGDVLVQGDARRATYAEGITLATSTPTIGSVERKKHPATGIEHFEVSKPEDLVSRIWKFWQEGTRFEWAVPCPHCREYFIPCFALLWYPDGATAARARREAKLTCARCGMHIDDAERSWMNAHGEFLAPGMHVRGILCPPRPDEAAAAARWDLLHANCKHGGELLGDRPDADDWTAWVSGLMSPWRSFGTCAAAWIAAARSHDAEKIQAVLNTVFGELYRERGEAPDWTVIKDIADASHYRLADVPADVHMIFLTVDVQQDRLVCVVRGWGVEFESWLIHREELWGETDQNHVWERLDQLADRTWSEHGIAAIAVDSGYRDERVFEWVGSRGNARATKGVYNPKRLYSATTVEVSRSGRTVRAGMKQWPIDSGYFKGWVHDRIGRPQDQPGAWHVPREIATDEVYCKQIVNETRMRLPSGKVQWRQSGPNDFLDCEALQVFLAHVEGVRHLQPASDDDGDDLAAIAKKLNT